jgi:hypothetical protein
MLTGVALAQRLARHLVPDPVPYVPDDGFQALFDGFSTDNWRMAGRGNFIVVDGTLEAVPGDDIGLYWCTSPAPPDFILKLDWLRWRDEDSSAVFVRFPDPGSKAYKNPAYVAVEFGFEVQLDKLGRPDGASIHKTGATYGEPRQEVRPQPVRVWSELEICVQGQTYTVLGNGELMNIFQNPHVDRGLPTSSTVPSFIGLQAHLARVAFRNIRIKAL